MIAAHNGSVDTVKLLIEARAKLDTKQEVYIDGNYLQDQAHTDLSMYKMYNY